MNTEILGNEIDKNGNTITIKKIDQLALSPVYTFFLRQMASLIDKGLALPMTSWDDYKCGAVYAEQDGKVLGHIVYDTTKRPGILWITLSAVEEDCRGRGIYTMLHRHFEKIARDKNCQYISSHVHVNNHARLKSAEKVGMKPQYYLLSKKL